MHSILIQMNISISFYPILFRFKFNSILLLDVDVVGFFYALFFLPFTRCVLAECVVFFTLDSASILFKQEI